MLPVKVVLSLLVTVVLAAPPVHASKEMGTIDRAAQVTVTAPADVVRVDAATCGTPIRYTVAPGLLPDGGSYDVSASLRNDDAASLGTDEAWFEEGDSYSGRIYPRCGKKLVSGVYTVSVEVTVRDQGFVQVETLTGAARVRMVVTRPAPTKLAVKKSPYGPAGWQWTGRLTSGGKPVVGQRVDLWWDYAGWEDYEVSKRTDRNGVAHWVSNPNGGLGGIKFRLEFAGTKKYAASTSTVFDIAPR